MTAAIVEALKQLDPANANHWTGDGLPRMETVQLLTGDRSLSRDAVTAALPGFTREAAAQGSSGPASTPAQAVSGVGSTGAGDAPQPPDSSLQGAGDGADGSGVPDSEVEQGEQAVQGGVEEDPLALAQRTLDAALKAQVETGKAVKEASATVDKLLDARERANVTPLASALSGYLEAQQRLRIQKGQRMAEWKNIPLADILPKRSALDDAFKRKNSRGAQRPVVPKK